MKMTKKNTGSMGKEKTKVRYVTIRRDEEGQRIDNYLLYLLKTMPKSHVYRLLRKGEVRVNKKRIGPSYRLLIGDELRLPPMFIQEAAKLAPPSEETLKILKNRILYEDNYLLVINKPAGISVHAGSTVRVGIIEALRFLYPKLPQLELVHRLDSETSGCLIIAKKKRILRECHQLLREGKIEKIYVALTKGKWKAPLVTVDLPLHKHYSEGGKHMVSVNKIGKTALTQFKTLQSFGEKASLMAIKLYTGRTHQIRVHALSQGHPIAGDSRYGDAHFNKLAHQLQLKRLFLHAKSIQFILPSLNLEIKVEAPLDMELEKVIQAFEARGNHERKSAIF